MASRLAVAASTLPDPVYFRIVDLVLAPLLRLTGGFRLAPIAQPHSVGLGVTGSSEAAFTIDRGAPPADEPSTPVLSPIGARARALIIDGFVPAPDKDAASVDIYWFMRILISLDYDVTFIPAFTTMPAGRYAEDLRALGILCPAGLTSANEFVGTNAATFDLIALYRTTVAEKLMDAVRDAAPDAQIIFNTVDLHFLRDQRQAELNGDLHAFVAAKRREKVELRIIRSADAAVMLSRFEYDYVQRHAPGGKHFLMPLASPVPGRLAPYEAREGALFVGGFAHAPNRDAVHWLCGTIWPLVREIISDARLYVVGADPPGDIRRYNAPDHGIEILGHIDDLSNLYRTVRVSVAPLRFGAGLKGKVVASLAVGLPCVVTSVASEGMPDGAASAIITADEPDDFAHALAKIYRNSQLWNQMSDAGVLYARAHFSIEAATQRVRKLLSALGLPAGESIPH